MAPESLRDEHIRQLAPFIIGTEKWAVCEARNQYWSWNAFEDFINNTFALDHEACIDAVFEMKPDRAEDFDCFVLRVNEYALTYSVDRPCLLRYVRGLMTEA